MRFYTQEMENRQERWAVVVLVVMTLLAMGRLCTMDFTWRDDDETIHQNPRMNPPTLATVEYYWTHSHKELYVPVTYMAWAGLAAIAHIDPPDARGVALNPWVFHTANVLVHLINVLVVYTILKRVVKNPLAACAGALVFAVHPVQVEAVGWVSGMKDLLCEMFVLLGVWQYLVYAQEKKALLYWGAFACTAVGTLCKPTAVVTPLLLAMIDRWVVGRSWRDVARGVWPFVVVVLPCVVWTKIIQNSVARGPLWSRPLVAADALAFYMGKLVWPVGLAFDYGHTPEWVIGSGVLYWTWVFPVSAGVVLWVGRRRWPVVVGAGAVFVIGLLPVLGLMPFKYQSYSTTADHYLYPAMLGVAMAAAWVVRRWPGRVMTGAVAVLTVGMALGSAHQAGYWENDITLNRRRLEVNPKNYLAHYNLGIALEFEARAMKSEQVQDEAIGHFREAIRLKPDVVLARSSLASILLARGKVTEGEELLKEAVRYGEMLPAEERKSAAPAHYLLGLMLERQGRLGEAAAEYRRALLLQPGSKPIAAALEKALRTMNARPTTDPAHVEVQ
ncbi:MAG TPA: tetratricopeptide repeat protein [Tepidisphaeraceae bacterium]|nr:tetratricopeptide repeat protein [Tepidisphaeraceae bacterium]